jgi:enoyl-CoA hydratase
VTTAPDATRPTYVRTWVDGRVRHVQLHRPDRLNAVSEELYADLEAVLEAAAVDAGLGAILLSGAGRAFCAGADLKAHADRDRDPDQRRAYVWAGQRVNRLLQRMPQAVVAAVHGHAIGAGAELAVSADVIVCTEDARFSFPEVGLGTFVGGGASRRLPQLVGQLRAKQVLMLGRPLTGHEAAAWGLATEAVPADHLDRRSAELAHELADQPARSLRLAKEALNRAADMTLDEALVYEAEGLLACMASDDWSASVHRFEAGTDDEDRSDVQAGA